MGNFEKVFNELVKQGLVSVHKDGYIEGFGYVGINELKGNITKLTALLSQYKKERAKIKAIPYLTKQELWDLRQQICLNSLYYSDYDNDFGIDRKFVYDFFDGYCDFLQEIMNDDGKDGDDDFFDYIDEYDNADNLEEWQYCVEYLDEDCKKMIEKAKQDLLEEYQDEISRYIDYKEEYMVAQRTVIK